MFTVHLVRGMQPNREQIARYVSRTLMLATALTPKLGYDRTTEIVHKAHHENLSLREAAVKSGYLTAEEFDSIIVPESMTHP